MNPIVRHQLDLNKTSRERWAVFATHRKNVTDLLGAGSNARLCVLGAGNCNDLDLTTLLTVHREIHLVDLDTAAVHEGVARQNVQADARVKIHGDIDVTAMLGVMAAWSPKSTFAPQEIAACAEAPRNLALLGPFDVVASTCMLSQLVGLVVDTIGERHRQFVPMLQAVRLGHLRLLVDLIAPDGVGVLISDFVSSNTVPELPSLDDDAIVDLLPRLVRDRNFYHGVNPQILESLFKTDPYLSARVTLAPMRFWCWDLGSRVYAVCGIAMRRNA